MMLQKVNMKAIECSSEKASGSIIAGSVLDDEAISRYFMRGLLRQKAPRNISVWDFRSDTI